MVVKTHWQPRIFSWNWATPPWSRCLMTVVRQAAPTKFSSSTGLVGRARVPGDKSISHRALLLGAISEGDTWITNLLSSRDTEATVDAVEALGAQVSEGGDGVVRVLGSGWSGLSEPDDVIAVSYTHLRAHETKANLVCRLLLEKKKKQTQKNKQTKPRHKKTKTKQTIRTKT